jgi:hypothetical protein
MTPPWPFIPRSDLLSAPTQTGMASVKSDAAFQKAAAAAISPQTEEALAALPDLGFLLQTSLVIAPR